jgi:hypothetical protein
MTWKVSGKIQEGEHVCDELNVQEDQDDDVVHDEGAVQGTYAWSPRSAGGVGCSERAGMHDKQGAPCVCMLCTPAHDVPREQRCMLYCMIKMCRVIIVSREGNDLHIVRLSRVRGL